MRATRVVSLGLLATGAALWYAGAEIHYTDPSRYDEGSFRLFAALGAVTLASLMDVASTRGRTALPRIPSRRLWLEIGLMIALLVLAWYMRTRFVSWVPPGDDVGYEEAQTGGIAYGMLIHGDRPLEYAFTNYWATLGFVTGGLTIGALRAPFTWLGIASVVPTYLFFRELVAWRVAAFIAGVWAVTQWLVVASRIADEIFFGVAVLPFALYFLARGLRRRNAVWLCWGGALCGMLLYEYPSYRSLPVMLLAAALLAAAWHAARLATRRLSMADALRTARAWVFPLVAFGFSAIIVATPLLTFELHGGGFLLQDVQRHEASRAGGGLISRNSVTRLESLARGYFIGGAPQEIRLNLPAFPYVDHVTGALLALAIPYAAINIRRPILAFASAWLGVILLVGGVVPSNYYVPRFTAALPAIFVLIAAVVQALAQRLDRVRVRLGRIPVGGAVLAALWAACVAANVSSMNAWAADTQVLQAYGDPTFGACVEMAQTPPGEPVFTWMQGRDVSFLYRPSDYTWACPNPAGAPLRSLSQIRDLPRPSSVVVVDPERYARDLEPLLSMLDQKSARIGSDGTYTVVRYELR